MDILMHLEPEENFRNVSERLLNSLYDPKSKSVTDIDNNILQQAKNEFKEILVLYNFNMCEIIEHLQNRNVDQPQRMQWFNSMLQKKSSKLLYQALVHSNSRYGDIVTNFDWCLKIIFGTNELKTMNSSFLQLTLSTINTNDKPKGKLYEIEKEMLKKFINILQSIDVNT